MRMQSRCGEVHERAAKSGWWRERDGEQEHRYVCVDDQVDCRRMRRAIT
jgi:hypothetical protein